MDKCADTRDDVNGKILYRNIIDDILHGIMYARASYLSMGPLHAVFFIFYLKGILLAVHVRTCDISASWRLDSVNAVGNLQIVSFTCECRVASFAFLSSKYFLFIRIKSGYYVLGSSGFSFEGTTVIRYGIASEGTTLFRCEMLRLVARVRRNFVKLMLSSACWFLTLWDLVSSIIDVSFWAEAL